jgi:hypothetical protein
LPNWLLVFKYCYRSVWQGFQTVTDKKLRGTNLLIELRLPHFNSPSLRPYTVWDFPVDDSNEESLAE